MRDQDTARTPVQWMLWWYGADVIDSCQLHDFGNDSNWDRFGIALSTISIVYVIFGLIISFLYLMLVL